VYDESFSSMRWGMRNEAVWCPPTDVYETENSAVVIIEIAGVSDGDYRIEQTGRTLVVSGERRDLSEKRAYQQMEIQYGRFRTAVRLPWALEIGGQHAIYEDGFLKITLTKAKTRRIPINVANEDDG
jgi:HSP20 family protein